MGLGGGGQRRGRAAILQVDVALQGDNHRQKLLLVAHHHHLTVQKGHKQERA